ncbi:MAG TPA: PQQ-binding-like beta-propeller repeat protein [Verrucomicrobiae bacterium]|jgi:outer membrane protein assembly factor BamB
MKTLPTRIAILIALSVCALRGAAQEWSRFRGPNGTGISYVKTIPSKITDADINWKVELPGTGHSSPVLWGERIFLTTTGDKSGGLFVLCLNAKDGHLLWRRDFPLTPFARHEFNSFAASTPAVDGQRVYVVWNEPEHLRLAALELDGRPVWQRDFGPFVSQHGCGISPIVFANKVILGNEQDDAKFVKDSTRSGKSFVVAVDAATGRTLWQTPRHSAVVAYSTPCVYEPRGGKPALIFNSQGHGIYALDPDTGKGLWDYAQAFDKRAVSSPIIAGNIILGSCGSGGGGSFVTAIKAGDSTVGRNPELAYQMKKSAPYVPTGIVADTLVWFWSDGGIVTCLDAPTGSIRYQERVGGNYFGSPVWVDGRLFCVSTAGELVVVEASDRFNLLHRYPLNELCHSTPAVALGRMFVHTEKHLISLGGAKLPPSGTE